MAANTKISWADHTFNPWIGCQKVSAGCDHCYAEALMADRMKVVEWGPHGVRKRTSEANWNMVRRWNKQAYHFKQAHGRPPVVFCASLADVFDNKAPEGAREDLFKLIKETPELLWMLLTKRPGNMRRMLPDDWGDGYPNVWLGATMEDQEAVGRRHLILNTTPAAGRFISAEPLIGPIEFAYSWLAGYIDMVIVGGESGSHFRPMDRQWTLDIRERCDRDGVSFHFKQTGGLRGGDPHLDGKLYQPMPGAPQ